MYAGLVRVSSVTPRDTLYEFDCPELAARAKPGQFVEVALGEDSDPFLRRPISIFDSDGERHFSLLVRTVGRGTQTLTQWEPGRRVDVLGPLGNGFTWKGLRGPCLLVGGGIGLAPLNYLGRVLQRQGEQVRLLFSPKRDCQLLAALSTQPLEVSYAENRSQLPQVLDQAVSQAGCVFACGPEGMLELTAQAAEKWSVPCQLSMERHMACGFGICLGCAIAVHTPEGLTYRKVCKDGPVFRAEEVAFHEQP